MAEQMMSNTTKGIIAVVLIVIVVFFISPNFSKIYASLKGDNFDSLKESQQQQILVNFDNFAAVAQECRNMKDDICICKDALKNYPNTFPKEFSIEILQDINAALIPKYDGIAITGRNKTIEMAGFSYVMDEIGKVVEKRRGEIKKISLDFKEDYPLVIADKDNWPIISGDLYKGSSPSTLNLIIFKFTTTTGGVWDTLLWGPMSMQQEFFSKFPECMDNRKDAISKFDAFILELKTKNEITINLPDDYSIFYDGKTINLDYKENDVRRYYDHNKTSDVVREFYSFNVKCEEPAIAGYFENSDKIKLARTGNDFCIEKI